MSVLHHLLHRKDCAAGPTFKNVSRDSDYASFGGNFLCKDRHLFGSVCFPKIWKGLHNLKRLRGAYHASYGWFFVRCIGLAV